MPGADLKGVADLWVFVWVSRLGFSRDALSFWMVGGRRAFNERLSRERLAMPSLNVPGMWKEQHLKVIRISPFGRFFSSICGSKFDKGFSASTVYASHIFSWESPHHRKLPWAVAAASRTTPRAEERSHTGVFRTWGACVAGAPPTDDAAHTCRQQIRGPGGSPCCHTVVTSSGTEYALPVRA